MGGEFLPADRIKKERGHVFSSKAYLTPGIDRTHYSRGSIIMEVSFISTQKHDDYAAALAIEEIRSATVEEVFQTPLSHGNNTYVG
jgi:hypothetical protein